MADAPLIYNYSPDTGEFTIAAPARPSPLEPDVFLLPANATEIAPPTAAANQIAQWTGEAWQLVADFRGTTYWLGDGSEHTITALGISPPQGALNAAPPPPLSDVQASAVDSVNTKAEDVRLRFVTGGATQAMVYIQKAAQAQAFAAAGYTGTVPPLVQSEATATNTTPQAAANSILAQVQTCMTAAAQIDEIRRKLIVDVDAATDSGSIATLLATAISALDGIHPS